MRIAVNKKSCCCCSGKEDEPGGVKPGSEPGSRKESWIAGFIERSSVTIPVVKTSLQAADTLGTVKVRLGIGRSNYKVKPGLYATGSPTDRSQVFVSSNYKLSFDLLRRFLAGMDAWILVLDTKGINVWCAAGKGTFGTAELVSRIRESGLENIVSHRTVILPQLGAPGVAAHTVKKDSGFTAVYGPLRAHDISPFIEGGMKATRKMRTATFNLLERLVLIPVEITGALKLSLAVLAFFYILSAFTEKTLMSPSVTMKVFDGFMLYLAGLISGAALVPLMLPWLPGRAFSIKGAIIGAFVGIMLNLAWSPPCIGRVAAAVLLVAASSSFFAMNFTGCTPFTSLSGVKVEMKYSLPVQIIALIAGLILWAINPSRGG